MVGFYKPKRLKVTYSAPKIVVVLSLDLEYGSVLPGTLTGLDAGKPYKLFHGKV